MNMAHLDSAAVRAELASIRSDFKYADLKMEQAQRLHDEVEHWTTVRDLDEVDVDTAEYFLEQYEGVLQGLMEIEFEEVPAQLAFADRSILAEIKATRQGLDTAIDQCQAMMARMSRIVPDCNESDEHNVEFLRQVAAAAVGMSGPLPVPSDAMEEICTTGGGSLQDGEEGLSMYPSPLHAILGLPKFGVAEALPRSTAAVDEMD